MDLCIFHPKYPDYNDILELPINDKTIENLFQNIINYTKIDYEKVRKIFSDGIREWILSTCFSERFDNSVMWYYYASKYEGFCVEYDMLLLYKLGLDGKRQVSDGTIWGETELHAGKSHLISLLPIIYSNQSYFPIELVEYVRAYKSSKTLYGVETELLKKIIPAFILKTPDWYPEKEWRMLYSRQMFNYNPLFKPTGSCIDLSSCITKIILGPQANEAIIIKSKEKAESMKCFVSKLKKSENTNTLVEEIIYP